MNYMKTIKIQSCKGCPDLGNHYHVSGDTYMLPNDKTEVELCTLNP